ncbi:hypothetical protein T06_15905 [Trichinella sp. T6]|nr:hypothetical protein T06_15905 [Trichinella sp. T6]
MIQITLERKTQNSNAGPNKNELDGAQMLTSKYAMSTEK